MVAGMLWAILLKRPDGELRSVAVGIIEGGAIRVLPDVPSLRASLAALAEVAVAAANKSEAGPLSQEEARRVVTETIGQALPHYDGRAGRVMHVRDFHPRDPRAPRGSNSELLENRKGSQ